MKGLDIKKALRNSKRIYGTLIVSTSPHFIKIVKNLKLDFVFIDTEHISIGRETLSWMCEAYRRNCILPLVRIPLPNPNAASMALDGGADGIVVPYIETVDQVKMMVGAVKYCHLKGKRLDNRLFHNERFAGILGNYIKLQNNNNVLIVNIESKPALDSLDDILAIEELDGVLIGPHDLSCSLDVPEQYFNPKYFEAVETIISKARAAGKGAGIHMVYENGLEQEIELIRLGANFIVHSADILFFQRGLEKDINEIKMALGDSVEEFKDQINI